jgi:hypothetical protein
MYGYAMVPKNLGCCARSSAAETEWRGTSEVEGALGWKTPSSCHCFWYFFSHFVRASRFSVCGVQISVEVAERGVLWGIYAFQLFGLGDLGRFQGFRGCFDCCHDRG